MIRKIIQIDTEKCNGCGLCAKACHEGAIGMVDGKAKLLRDDYCDGLGDCLPACPVKAISFTVREAAAYDEAAVLAKKGKGSQLQQWPVQIRLVPVEAPFFQGADLLVAADCTAYGDSSEQRDPKRNSRADGSSVLRRYGKRSEKGAAGQREITSVAGGDDFY